MAVGFLRKSSVPFLGWNMDTQATQIRRFANTKVDWKVSENTRLIRQNPEMRLRSVGLIKEVEAGEQIYIAEFSRLFINIPEIARMLKFMDKSGAQLISVKERFDSSKPQDLEYLEGLSEFLNAARIERAGALYKSGPGKIGRPPKNAYVLLAVVKSLVAGHTVTQAAMTSRQRGKELIEELGITKAYSTYSVTRDYIHRHKLTKRPMQEYFLGLSREELRNDQQVKEGAEVLATKLKL